MQFNKRVSDTLSRIRSYLYHSDRKFVSSPLGGTCMVERGLHCVMFIDIVGFCPFSSVKYNNHLLLLLLFFMI